MPWQADCPNTQIRCVLLNDVTYDTYTGTYTKAGVSGGASADGPQASVNANTKSKSGSTTTAKGSYVGSFETGRCYKFLVGCFAEQCRGHVDHTTVCNQRFPACAGACEAQCTKCCNGEAPPWMC
jgi:hypothetical protein